MNMKKSTRFELNTLYLICMDCREAVKEAVSERSQKQQWCDVFVGSGRPRNLTRWRRCDWWRRAATTPAKRRSFRTTFRSSSLSLYRDKRVQLFTDLKNYYYMRGKN